MVCKRPDQLTWCYPTEEARNSKQKHRGMYMRRIILRHFRTKHTRFDTLPLPLSWLRPRTHFADLQLPPELSMADTLLI